MHHRMERKRGGKGLGFGREGAAVLAAQQATVCGAPSATAVAEDASLYPPFPATHKDHSTRNVREREAAWECQALALRFPSGERDKG